MKIEKNSVVSMHYKLTDNDGQLVDKSDTTPLAYLHGHGQIVPGLEKELEGRSVGDKLTVAVAPGEGYGEYAEELLVKVEKNQLADIPNLEVGMQVEGESPEGVAIFTIVEITDVDVTLDGNHPLAGEVLNFEVSVESVRAATEEEITHGHAHGEGGQIH